MVKERQKDFLEENGFQLSPNNEYVLKFEDRGIQFLWSIPHQVGVTYFEGNTEMLYDFDQLVEVLDYLVGIENKF